jgi:hypothetical protein
MSTVGSREQWPDTFPNGLIPAIVSLVLDTWTALPKPTRDDHETAISRSLRNAMRQAKNLSRALPCLIDREVVEDDPESGEEKGRIDIRFIQGCDESVYFAFECKRLNVPANGGCKSLAREYVDEGMMRFVTGKYATGLTQGGMIGFVMDGKSATATAKVDEAIRARLGVLLMSPGVGLAISSLFPSTPTLRETRHPRRSPALTLHHVFLEV